MKIRDILPDTAAYNDPSRPFYEHLVALRNCLIGCMISWILCCCIAGAVSPWVLDWIKAPAQSLIESGKISIQGLDLTSGFSTIMAIALWGGTAFSVPFLAFYILRFVFPGLKVGEKLFIMFYLIAGGILFAGGVWLAYEHTLPIVVDVFQKINQWVNLPVTTVRIEGYASIVLKTVLAFGIAFQLPPIVFALGWIGLISSDTLRKQRRLAIVVIFFLGMVLTPPDPVSQLLMAVPMCALYELCIWAVRLRELTTGTNLHGASKGKSQT